MPPIEGVISRSPRMQRDRESISKANSPSHLPLLSERFRRESSVASYEQNDETLVVDGRSGISPAQAVEEKLTRMLRDASLPISHLQTRKLLRPR